MWYAWCAQRTARVVRACVCVCVWCAGYAQHTEYVVRVVFAAHRARGARACVFVCVYVWCAWCVRLTASVVRARARVCVVRVVRAAHRSHGARACVCICGARDARSAQRAWCARICVCVWLGQQRQQRGRGS